MWLLSSILDRTNVKKFFFNHHGKLYWTFSSRDKILQDQGARIHLCNPQLLMRYGEFTCSCMYCLINFLIGKPTF